MDDMQYEDMKAELGAIIDLKHRFAYRMAELLRELEWHHAECLICGGVHKHEPACKLAAILAEWSAS